MTGEGWRGVVTIHYTYIHSTGRAGTSHALFSESAALGNQVCCRRAHGLPPGGTAKTEDTRQSSSCTAETESGRGRRKGLFHYTGRAYIAESQTRALFTYCVQVEVGEVKDAATQTEMLTSRPSSEGGRSSRHHHHRGSGGGSRLGEVQDTSHSLVSSATTGERETSSSRAASQPVTSRHSHKSKRSSRGSGKSQREGSSATTDTSRKRQRRCSRQSSEEQREKVNRSTSPPPSQPSSSRSQKSSKRQRCGSSGVYS